MKWEISISKSENVVTVKTSGRFNYQRLIKGSEPLVDFA